MKLLDPKTMLSEAGKRMFDLVRNPFDGAPLVYVAGPLFGSGRASQNVYRALKVGEAVCKVGLVPFVPHLFLTWDTVSPQDAGFWLTMDFAVLNRCAALVLLPGDSPGAEAECYVAAREPVPTPVYALDAADMVRILAGLVPHGFEQMADDVRRHSA